MDHISLGVPPERLADRSTHPGTPNSNVVVSGSGGDVPHIMRVRKDPTPQKCLLRGQHLPGADKWIDAALADIEARELNGTWELAQLPPGKRTIGSRWVFKVKKTPEGSTKSTRGLLLLKTWNSNRWTY